MPLSAAAIRKLGSVVVDAERTVAEMIRERGGSAANVRHAGPWASMTLAFTAETAVADDLTAEMVIKIVKQARGGW